MNSRSIQCPCCKRQKKEKEYRKVLSLFPFEGAIRDMNSNRYYIDKRLYQWACDACIQSGLALMANPKKQYHTFFSPEDTAPPYLSYYDQNRRCQQCDVKFTFTKEEQIHWYEQLKFVVYAQPKHCLNCRKEIRKTKDLNSELSNLLKEGTPSDLESLERIAQIYAQMGNEEKAKVYQNRVIKLKAKSHK